VPKPKARVLILARDPVIAALIGMLLEMDGYEPGFPAPGETAEQALGRLRAPLIVCADCEIPDAQSDLFFARVTRSGARFVLFGAPGSEERLRDLAARRSARYFMLPTDRATLARALGDALHDIHTAPTRDR
jgi:DNA-binding NtrC family response regulator